jgi:DNA-binding transcriptional LysR family regulator
VANWDDYRFFVSLSRTRSVRASAGQLRVNPSTVTRRLDALEARLGQKLFVRGRSGLRLTADGEALLTELEPLAAGLVELERKLLDGPEQVAGTVRVTLPDAFAEPLMPEFATYAKEHPALQLELLAAGRVLDLDRGEADLAIRVTNQPPEQLIGRGLGGYRLAAYASRRYLTEHDPGSHPQECAWIESEPVGEAAARIRARHFPALPAGGRVSSVHLLRAALVAHMGIGVLPCLVGDADGELGRVGAAQPLDGAAIWLLFHPDLRGVARIQSVSSHIQDAFQRLKPRLLG